MLFYITIYFLDKLYTESVSTTSDTTPSGTIITIINFIIIIIIINSYEN